MTTTYVLIHGGGDAASSWDLVAKDLRDRGSDVVAVDLPIEDLSAGWSAYADAVVEATGERSDVVVVAHSLGGFTAPLVCTRMPVGLLVLVAAMVPVPGERAIDYWANAGYEEGSDGDEVDVFFHDVPPELAAQAMRAERDQADTPMYEPWPLDAWPHVTTRYLLCRDDRMFPAAVTRRVVRERLGIEPDEIDGGHCPFLSRPGDLTSRLTAYRAELPPQR